MGIYSIFALIGGLGLFFFGMQRMAEGLQKAAGNSLRRILELFTSRPIIAIFTGTITTMLVQSSSTTTVMIVGFVNAGLMNLQQAVATIMGANIGTTITAQIISFNVYLLALPAVGIGFGLQFFGKKKIQRYIGQGIFGFGLLLLGLSTMSDAVSPLQDYQPFLQWLVILGRIPIFGVLIGTIFTALVQSSSATTGLVIAFSLQNLITLPAAISLTLGANIGTCITAILASLGASLTARRAALAHTLFNTFGVIIFLIFLTPFTSLVLRTGHSISRQVANAHTIFNVINTLLIFPFINQFVALVTRLIPGEEEILERKPKYLDERMLHSPAAVMSAHKETIRMAEISLEMLEESLTAFSTNNIKLVKDVEQKEDVVNELEKAIMSYLTEATQVAMTTREYHRITGLMHTVNDIERVADHATNITELASEKIEHELKLSEIAQEELATMQQAVVSLYAKAIETLRFDRVKEARALIDEDDIIDEMERRYRQTHIQRLNEGSCSPEIGVLFLDLISNLERVADHATNVAEAVAGTLTTSAE